MDATYNHTKYMNALVPTYADINPTEFTGEFDDFEAFRFFLTEEELAQPFSGGLTSLLKKPYSGYSGDLSDNKEKANYLYQQMQALPSDVTKATVKSWVEGKHTPSVTPTNRQRMYEICFALHLPFEEVVWFFHHVFLDRSFNCHTIKEAVYYYCFQHQLPYSTAQELIQKVEDAPEPDTPAENIRNYTTFVKEQLSSFQTEEELLNYLISNKHCFRTWNQTALSYIQEYMAEIKGSVNTKDSLDRLKRSLLYHSEKRRTARDDSDTLHTVPHDLKNYGLLLQEIYTDPYSLTSNAETIGDAVLETLKSKDVFSNDFMLDIILGTLRNKIIEDAVEQQPEGSNPDGPKKEIKKEKRIQMVKQLPESIRRNFPSKMTISTVLDPKKNQVSEGYDAIRKVLILLKFYTFWCKIKLKDPNYAEYSRDELTGIYLDETNSLLADCGYEPLYAGNPYDILFLIAAHNKVSPLAFFRRTIETLLNLIDEEEEEDV